MSPPASQEENDACLQSFIWAFVWKKHEADGEGINLQREVNRDNKLEDNTELCSSGSKLIILSNNVSLQW